MCASTNQDFLLALPEDVRREIFSYLEPEDLLSVSKLSKAHRADLQEMVKEPPSGEQRSAGSAAKLALYLDALAGLVLLDARLAKIKPDPICVAVAVLADPKAAKARPKPELVITSNTGNLPDARTKVTWKDSESFNGSWVIKGQYDLSLKNYVEPWLHCTDDEAISQAVSKELQGALRGANTVVPDREFSSAPKQGNRPRARPLYMHAEMKLLDLLWSGTLRPPTNDGTVYIGLSLLCCRHCMRAITAFNTHNPHSITIGVAGTHDVPYAPSNWTIPQFLKDKTNEQVRETFFAQYQHDKAGFLLSIDPNLPIDDARPSVLSTK